MIPIAEVTPQILSPIPKYGMPSRDEITEEGFGYFRDTWSIGRVTVREAEETLTEEAAIIDALDQLASTPDEYELLASAIENRDPDDLPRGLLAAARPTVLSSYLDAEGEDFAPLDGLEIGVAGLTHALSVIRCLTAASCRSHVAEYSWSDCPVVFFAAPDWRLELLVPLISDERCGLDEDKSRSMLYVYGASIRSTHELAKRILSERARFRARPAHLKPSRSTSRGLELGTQLRLPVDDG